MLESPATKTVLEKWRSDEQLRRACQRRRPSGSGHEDGEEEGAGYPGDDEA